MPSLLHLGCGNSPKPVWAEGYDEVRLDIDPGVRPDIVASMTDLGEIGPFDAVFSSHCLEHLWPHEVPVALAETRRVLRKGGFAVFQVPDLEGIKPTEDVVYESHCGPVTGLDMIYGKAAFTQWNPHMAHRCGFVMETLRRVFEAAGFDRVEVAKSPYNLHAVAVA